MKRKAEAEGNNSLLRGNKRKIKKKAEAEGDTSLLGNEKRNKEKQDGTEGDSSLLRDKKRTIKKRKAEAEGDNSLLESEKGDKERKDKTEGDSCLLKSMKEKFLLWNKNKRMGVTGDDSVTENKKTKHVISQDATSKTLNATKFRKMCKAAKSDRTKEKAKMYKKKSNKKKQPVVDEGKIVKECIEYLNKWKNDKPNWKFEKIKQIKLVNNMFHPVRVSDEIFPIFVEYIAGSSGHVRKLVCTKATEVVEEMERWLEMTDEEKSMIEQEKSELTEKEKSEMTDQEKSESSQKPDEMKYNRAREILQALDE